MTKVGRIIAGPCQHETLAQSAEIAKECQRVCDKYDVSYFFKASFDKANRTSDSGVRGLDWTAPCGRLAGSKNYMKFL